MKTVLLALVLASATANAKTFYIVDGQLVTDQAAAKRAAVKNPKSTIMKIQATYAKWNEDKFNLNKSEDATLDEVKKALVNVKN